MEREPMSSGASTTAPPARQQKRWRRPHEWSWQFWFVLLLGLTALASVIGIVVYLLR